MVLWRRYLNDGLWIDLDNIQYYLQRAFFLLQYDKQLLLSIY